MLFNWYTNALLTIPRCSLPSASIADCEIYFESNNIFANPRPALRPSFHSVYIYYWYHADILDDQRDWEEIENEWIWIYQRWR